LIKAAPVVYFDGVCNLCNSSVLWIIRRDKKRVFQFASLQGKAGSDLIDRLPNLKQLDSMLLVYNGKVFTQSGAALRIAVLLGFPTNLMAVGFLIPAFIRNALYRFVAKNRYRWFGKQEVCALPNPELANRFLQ
jgi:predicted DCC family thiol-disulfide oxidoreductase YuxK